VAFGKHALVVGIVELLLRTEAGHLGIASADCASGEKPHACADRRTFTAAEQTAYGCSQHGTDDRTAHRGICRGIVRRAARRLDRKLPTRSIVNLELIEGLPAAWHCRMARACWKCRTAGQRERRQQQTQSGNGIHRGVTG